MTIEERIAFCVAQAEEIESNLGPQKHPHEWETPRLVAAMWRNMAQRLAESKRA